MEQDEAAMLTAKLLAAWPGQRENLTAAVYIEQLQPFRHDLALEAINELIRNERWLPTVAAVLDQYHLTGDRIRERARLNTTAIDLPDIPEAERQTNLQLAAEWLGRIGKSIQ